MNLNLSRSPFVDVRPVRRLVIVLWVAGALLFAANAFLYYEYFTGSSLTREQQVQIRQRMSEEQERIRELRATLAELDVERQNEQAAFINERISQRTFSWSKLFDHVSEALPGDVRLTRLSPQFRRDIAVVQSDEGVNLALRGVAKSGEALLGFVDALFDHPSFRYPNLNSEARRDGGLFEFDLNVVYDLSAEEAAPAVAAEEEEQPTAASDAETVAPVPSDAALPPGEAEDAQPAAEDEG